MFAEYPVWQTHLEAAQDLWQKIVLPKDTVIDATCGNGYDTVTLAQLAYEGKVWAFDIQKEAIQNTAEKLKNQNLHTRVEIRQHSHETFPVEIFPESVRLIVYNLGYLPGGNKKKTTLTETTLQSIHNAMPLLLPGGALSITIYPGHNEGKKELEALLDLASGLSPSLWQACHLQWINRDNAPSLLWLCKSIRNNK